MLLKNKATRLITINGAMKNSMRSKAYQIKPGKNPAVEVPDELCKNKFVEGLIEDGSLEVMGQPATVEEVEPTDDERDLLLAEAMDLDLDVKDSWATSTLKRKVTEARKAAEAE